MDYQDYSQWKGWLTQAPFGHLSQLQEKKYAAQLAKLGIAYKGIDALEIGYGNGAFLSFLLKNGSRVAGVEIQAPLLDAARVKGISVQSSVDEVAGGPYDLIVAFDVLEHMTVPQLQALFAKCRGLLKANGAMLFRFPNADSFAGMPAQHGDFTHITPIGQTKLHQIIEPQGFRIERFEAEDVYPRRVLIDAFRAVCRYVFMHAVGIGNSYYFACNVVALVKFDAGAQRA